MSALALALFLQAAAGTESGVAPGRTYSGQTYDELVALGIARGRAGDLEGAADAFNEAVIQDPQRREARVERGGLRFLQKRYAEAAQDLGQALAFKEDAYVRELLASTLLLAGRTEEALSTWNPLGRPRLRAVELLGLQHTQDRVARRELAVEPGGLLEVDQFLESRLRLQETGVFDRVRLRTVPTQTPGEVTLEIDLAERHGFGPMPVLVGRLVGDLARRRFRPRYDNLLGSGLTVSAEYKWERTQPLVRVALDMVRPLGLPANLHLEAQRARPQYDFDGPTGEDPFTLRTRGGAAALRRVVSPRTVAEIGVAFRERSFSVDRDDATPGRLAGLSGGVERRFRDTQRHRLDASAHLFRTSSILGSDVAFGEVRLRAASYLYLRPPEPAPILKSVLAAQITGAWADDGMPLDAMFAPGAASEMPLPLRAHRHKRGGILGRAPLGRSLALLNLEMRQRIHNRRDFQAGIVLFYDGARLERTVVGGRAATLHDIGAGIRLGVRRTLLLRIDFGYGLSDGKSALTGGIGQVF